MTQLIYNKRPGFARDTIIHPDPYVVQAERETFVSYAVNVDVLAKGKSILRVGRNDDIDNAVRETIWLQGGDETYATTNAIDTISSSNAGDSQDVTIEYCTVSGTGTSSQFTFGTQTATLNGQTKVVLTTACARVLKVTNASGTTFAGDVYVYEDDTITAGVPDTAANVHAKVLLGEDQSFKACDTIANTDYAFITKLFATSSPPSTTDARVSVRLEVRKVGLVFVPEIELTVTHKGGLLELPLKPYLVVPKNADIRMTAYMTANNFGVNAGFQSILASVQ